MIIAKPLLKQARGHWFLLLLPVLLLVEYGFARSTDWSRPGPAEAAILFDLCLFVPLLYVLCYRKSLPLQALIIRVAALFLSGLYIASLLVPPEEQLFLSRLSWLRPLGLVALALIELKLLIEVTKMVFSSRSNPEQISARMGIPEWVARLMLLEARFWKAVWRLLRGR